MRKFAFFLPQFHEIKENNEWWGEHFTEWTNVRAAKPLYKGHNQPIAPLEGNYYNLLEKETVEWQTKLAREYNVDGFIYYHYYFNGKKLLEKPAENLLRWKDIDQKFFFCWANHSWNRSWNGSREVLLEQTYGSKEDWEKHINYLLPFFLDSRYEKKDNKPLFMVFNSDVPEFKELFDFFDDECKKAGFDGINIIETKRSVFENDFKYTQTGYMFYREPTISLYKYCHRPGYLIEGGTKKIAFELAKRNLLKYIRKFNGEKLYKIIKKYDFSNPQIINGVFFSWDNTPRHAYRGSIITEPTKESFFEYMDRMKTKDYVFINAWNEWAEGMVLEPTKHNEFKFL